MLSSYTGGRRAFALFQNKTHKETLTQAPPTGRDLAYEEEAVGGAHRLSRGQKIMPCETLMLQKGMLFKNESRPIKG